MIDNDAGRNILMSELNTMISNLDESIKTPFIMHYTGYKYQEIAEKLELPLGTVKSRIFFARKELKQSIKKQYGDLYSVRERLTA
jgi:RNA polymerase sigma-70 factor (ECF subfamily)